MIRKRQREGIEAAKKKGKHLGRPQSDVPANFDKVYDAWMVEEITAKEAQKKLGMSSSSFYRLVARKRRMSRPKGG